MWMERKKSKLCHTEEFLPFCHGEWEMAEGSEHEVICSKICFRKVAGTEVDLRGGSKVRICPVVEGI